MTKDEAYEVIDTAIGSNLCYSCPFFVTFEEGDYDCFVDNPSFCPCVQLEEQND